MDGLYFPCSNLHLKEEITFVEAFAHSCNSVFINLALELGPEKIAAYARRFGLGNAAACRLLKKKPGIYLYRKSCSAPGAGQLRHWAGRMVTPLQARR